MAGKKRRTGSPGFFKFQFAFSLFSHLVLVCFDVRFLVNMSALQQYVIGCLIYDWVVT